MGTIRLVFQSNCARLIDITSDGGNRVDDAATDATATGEGEGDSAGNDAR
jgi:hypothetical protein